MVRIILADDITTVESLGGPGLGRSITGKGEYFADSAVVVLADTSESVTVTSGEWVGLAGQFAQTSEHVREVYLAVWILLPLVFVLGFKSVIKAFTS